MENNNVIITDERIAEIKADFLENLWEVRLISAPKGQKLRYNKYVDHRLHCTNEIFGYFVQGLYSSMKQRNKIIDREDVFQEAALACQLAMMKFKAKGKDDWNWELFASGDKDHMSYLFGYLKKAVTTQTMDFEDEMNNTTKQNRYEGEKGEEVSVSTYTSMIISSYDKEMDTEDGMMSLMMLLSEEEGLYYQHQNNEPSHFLEWYRENRERLLTSGQLKFMDQLEKCWHKRGTGGYTVNDASVVTGLAKNSITEKKQTIGKRLLKKYNQEFPFGEKSHLQRFKERQIELFTPFIDLVYCDEEMIDEQNRMISNWIIENMDKPILNDLIYDNLQGEDIFNLVKGYKNEAIPAQTIYKIVELVENHLNGLELMDTSVVAFYKKPEEALGGWTKDKHEEYANYKKAFMYPDLYHWNEETKTLTELGENPNKKKNYKKKRLTPGGVEIDVNNEEEENALFF